MSETETARDLVRQLEEAGEWVDPELLKAIAAQGEAAVELLVEIVRRDVERGEESDALYFALMILPAVGARPAIPALLALYRDFDDEILDRASIALASCGPEVIEPLLNIVGDTSLGWYHRFAAGWGARGAAGDDLALRQRIAEVLRNELSRLVESPSAEALDQEAYDWIASLVHDLAGLADPLSRELIERAFDARLVDEFFINRDDVERLYAEGGNDDFPDPDDWLGIYPSNYEQHMKWLNRPPEPAPGFPVRSSVPESFEDEDYEPYSDVPPVEPIRYTRPRPGRNDPCWCGSGKKYKKCHLAADEASSPGPG